RSWRSCSLAAISRPGGANARGVERNLHRVATPPARDHGVGMATSEDLPAARTACVVVGAAPEQVAAVGTNTRTTLRTNKLGTLVPGRARDLVIRYPAHPPRPGHGAM